MKRYRYSVPLALTLIIFSSVSCGKEDPLRHDLVKVRVMGLDTKGPAITEESLRLSDGFMMEAFVGEYSDYTKDPVEDFNPWVDNTNGHYFSVGVEYSSTEWRLKEEQMWVANIPTSFWCHAPVNVSGTLSFDKPESPNASDRKFHYSMINNFKDDRGTPLDDTDDIYQDADNADDLIFAYEEQTFDGSNEYIDIHFYHALSQICFSVSPDDGKFDKNLKIDKIEIENLPVYADCVFHGAPEGDDIKPEDRFIWSNFGSNIKNLKQTFDASFSKGAPKGWETGSYSENSETFTLYSSTNHFYVIPHQMNGQDDNTTGTQLKITFDDDGEKHVVSRPLKDTLKPGYYYKYKIDATVLGRTIDVDVHLVDWLEYDDQIIVSYE